MIAHDASELQFRSEVMLTLMDGVSDRKGAGLHRSTLRSVADEDVVPARPVPFVVEPMAVCLRDRLIRKHRMQIAPAAVVVLGMVEVGHRMPLHVRLSCKQEDLDGRWRHRVFLLCADGCCQKEKAQNQSGHVFVPCSGFQFVEDLHLLCTWQVHEAFECSIERLLVLDVEVAGKRLFPAELRHHRMEDIPVSRDAPIR